MKHRHLLWATMFAVPLFASPAKQLQHEHVPGELIVKLKDGFRGSFLKNARSFGVQQVQPLKVRSGNYFKVKTNSRSLETAIVNLNQLAEVEYAEPNFIYRTTEVTDPLSTFPNDPRFGELWGLKNTGDNDPKGMDGVEGADVDAQRAWSVNKGNRGVRIAVIDTGVDYSHPDLMDNMWINEAEANGEPGVDDDGNGFVDDIHGYDFANDDGDPMDGHSHGTHCAGTIAASHDNGEGVAGVMAEASIVAIKFLTDSGSGTTANAIESIDYATAMDVDIMSNSWGGGGFSQALADSITRAEEKGIYFVAAAGNSGTDNDSRPHYPSSYENDNVISVAAHNIGDNLASFTCFGRTSVDIAAPGRNTLSTVLNGRYGVKSGTSMATPHVSGVLGLLVAQEGRVAVSDMRERLLASSVPTTSYRRKMTSGGRVNAYNLLMNIYPERPGEPDPNLWQTVALDEVFETAHPYTANNQIEATYNYPGAKFIRVVVEKYDIESGYDFLYVKDKNGITVESISGSGENYYTDYVEGDSFTLSFKSDYSVHKWGAVVRSIQVIY